MGAEAFALQIGGCEGFRVAQQGVEEPDVGAGPGVGLGGAGHAEPQLPAADGLQQVPHRNLLSHKAQLLSQALPDAEHHRGDGNGFGVL